MKMSQRYDEEQKQLKKDIEELQRQCDKDDDRAYCKDQFLKAVRKFMEMKTLTPTILHELVERIDVYQTQGTGKNRTQRIVIHYNFIGVLDMRKRQIAKYLAPGSRMGARGYQYGRRIEVSELRARLYPNMPHYEAEILQQ